MLKLFLPLGFLLLTVAGSVQAAPAPAAYTPGKEYQLIANPKAPPDAKQVTVQEFFWYACSHCYDFEPYLTPWIAKKPAWMRFERVPNSLGRPVGALHQRAFYVADLLGIEDRIHLPLMRGIHDGDASLATLEGIRALYQKQAGVPPAKFDGLAGSFVVDGKLRAADQLALDYRVLGTPTVVIDGKYLTDNGMAGGFPQVLKVIDFLAAKSRDERGLSKR